MNYGTHEPVPATAECFYQVGPASVVTQCSPNLPDAEIQARLKVDEGLLLPKMLTQTCAGYNFARA